MMMVIVDSPSVICHGDARAHVNVSYAKDSDKLYMVKNQLFRGKIQFKVNYSLLICLQVSKILILELLTKDM